MSGRVSSRVGADVGAKRTLCRIEEWATGSRVLESLPGADCEIPHRVWGGPMRRGCATMPPTREMTDRSVGVGCF